MKLFLGLLILLSSLGAQASFSPIAMPKSNPWAFGVGFGTESNYDSVSLLEIKTPTLFTFFQGTNHVSLVLSYETKEISFLDRDITPIHLLIELTGPRFQDIVRSYVRLGGGSVLIDDSVIYPASNFFNVQFQLGVDVITGMSATGVGSSFFLQAMLNSPAIRNPPLGSAEIYDGTTMLAGFRMYF